MFTHRLSVKFCPSCSNNLSAEDAVFFKLRDHDGADLGRRLTCLDELGRVMDLGGAISSGFYGGVFCAVCRSELSMYEAEGRVDLKKWASSKH